MVRTYKQKNSYLPNSKHSDSAFVDILRCYIQGVSTGEAAAIVTENNRLRGEKSVSRQAIQSLYKQSGELLWMLGFEVRKGRLPQVDESPDADLEAVRAFVYDPDRFIEITQTIEDSPLLRWIGITPSELSNDEAVKRLRKFSIQAKGLSAKTFYIHWAREFWIARFVAEGLSETQAQDRLLEKLLSTYLSPPTYEEQTLSSKQEIKKTEYFRYGHVFARVQWDEYGDPISSERFCQETQKMVSDPLVLQDIYFGDPGGLEQITEDQFLKIVSLNSAE